MAMAGCAALAARLVTNHSAWTNAQNERVIYCTAAISVPTIPSAIASKTLTCAH